MTILLVIKLFFYGFESQNQNSSPKDDGGQPCGSNTRFGLNTYDTPKEQSSVEDQIPVHIGEENFPEGSVPKNSLVPTTFVPKKFSTLKRVAVLEALKDSIN